MSPGPWLEASHPWGTGLYDLEFHVLLVPIAIGTTDQVADLEIRGFEITERDGLIAVSQDAIEMFLDHPCKAEVGFETAPFELGHPAVEEPAGPRLRSVGPEVTEGFLEHMSLEEALVGIEDLVERLPRLAPDVGLSGKEDELLAGQDMAEPFRRPAQLGDPDLVERLQEMPDHVELVVDDLNVGAVGLEAVPESLPHIHGGMGDEARPLLAEPSPEPLQVLLPAPIGDIEHLGSPGTLQRTDEGQVVLTFTDGYLIDSQNGDAVQGTRRLDLLQGLLIDPFDGFPMQVHEQPHGLVRHYLAQLEHYRRHRDGYASLFRDEGHPLHCEAACRAVNPVSRQPQDGAVFPQGEVLYLDAPVGMGLLESPAAYPALEGASRSYQVYDSDPAPLPFLDRYAGNSIAFDSEKCGKITAHRVAPLVDFLADFNVRIHYPMPSFLPPYRTPRNEPPFSTSLAGLSGALEGSTSSRPGRYVMPDAGTPVAAVKIFHKETS